MGYTPGPFIKLSLAVTVTPFLSVSKETDQHLPFPIPSVSMYLSTWGTSLPLADYALVEFGVVGFLFVCFVFRVHKWAGNVARLELLPSVLTTLGSVPSATCSHSLLHTELLFCH